MGTKTKVARTRSRRRLQVRFGAQGASKVGFTTNFSRTGLFITTPAVLAPKSTFQMEIQGPEKTFQLRGRVVWAKKSPARFSQSMPSGMGVELTDPGPDWVEFCEKYG